MKKIDSDLAQLKDTEVQELGEDGPEEDGEKPKQAKAAKELEMDIDNNTKYVEANSQRAASWAKDEEQILAKYI